MIAAIMIKWGTERRCIRRGCDTRMIVPPSKGFELDGSFQILFTEFLLRCLFVSWETLNSLEHRRVIGLDERTL
jgi:hypothetical protein